METCVERQPTLTAIQQVVSYPHPLFLAREQTGERVEHLYALAERALAVSFRIVSSPWFLVGGFLAGGLTITAEVLERRAE